MHPRTPSLWLRPVIAFALSVLLAACASAPAASDLERIERGEVTLKTGPEVSSSRGEPGGFVLLWPRVIPRAQLGALRAEAKALQERLHRMLLERFPNRPIDVRPEPERVCSKVGCKATAVGALVIVDRGYCAVVALVSDPGRSPQRLIPWSKGVRMPQTVPFREPPESSVRVEEFIPCSDLASPLAAEADLGRLLDALP